MSVAPSMTVVFVVLTAIAAVLATVGLARHRPARVASQPVRS
jgi:hypothetical protein